MLLDKVILVTAESQSLKTIKRSGPIYHFDCMIVIGRHEISGGPQVRLMLVGVLASMAVLAGPHALARDLPMPVLSGASISDLGKKDAGVAYISQVTKLESTAHTEAGNAEGSTFKPMIHTHASAAGSVGDAPSTPDQNAGTVNLDQVAGTSTSKPAPSAPEPFNPEDREGDDDPTLAVQVAHGNAPAINMVLDEPKVANAAFAGLHGRSQMPEANFFKLLPIDQPQGEANLISMLDTDADNATNIDQSGSSNRLIVTQAGLLNLLSILQSGQGGTIQINQATDRNSAVVSQTGTASVVTIFQAR